MYPSDDIPDIIPVGNFKFLGTNDVLQKGDFLRCTTYPNFGSDTIFYGYIRQMNWIRVGDDYKTETMGCWVGKTIGYLRQVKDFDIEVIRPVK